MLLAYDTETTGLRPFDDSDMFAFATCTYSGRTADARLDTGDSGLRKLRALFDSSPELVLHNAKFDFAFTEKALGKRLIEDYTFHDTFLQAHLLKNDRHSYKLKELAWELGGVPRDDEALVKKYAGSGDDVDYSRVPEDIMHDYVTRDAFRTMLLHRFFYPKLQAEPKMLECYEAEIDLLRTSLRMEERGIRLHRGRCQSMIDMCERVKAETLQEAERVIGRPVDIGKDAQVRALLFEELNFEPVAYTPAGKPSVKKEYLDEMAQANPHPVLDLIVKHKSHKAGASMLQGYMKRAAENGDIHCNLNTCQARTARESCSNPNMQNVQKEANLKNRYPIPARKVFVPRDGFLNFHIDYSGIEFRIAVNFTGDKKLFKLAVEDDLHAVGASILYGDVWQQADKDQRKLLRSAGKNANFAKMYGAGMAKIASTLGAGVSASKLRAYDAVFGSLEFSAQMMVEDAKEKGHVETFGFGRRLFVPPDKPYIATNYRIQGTAAEVLKRAQNRVHRYLQEATSGEAQLLLPIHDEIIIEWPRKRLRDAQEILREVKKLMTDFPMFEVPLDVDIEYTTVDWSKKHPYRLED